MRRLFISTLEVVGATQQPQRSHRACGTIRRQASQPGQPSGQPQRFGSEPDPGCRHKASSAGEPTPPATADPTRTSNRPPTVVGSAPAGARGGRSWGSAPASAPTRRGCAAPGELVTGRIGENVRLVAGYGLRPRRSGEPATCLAARFHTRAHETKPGRLDEPVRRRRSAKVATRPREHPRIYHPVEGPSGPTARGLSAAGGANDNRLLG